VQHKQITKTLKRDPVFTWLPSGHRTSPGRPGTKRRPSDVQNEIKVVQKGRRNLKVLSNSFGPFFETSIWSRGRLWLHFGRPRYFDPVFNVPGTSSYPLGSFLFLVSRNYNKLNKYPKLISHNTLKNQNWW